MIGPEMMTIPVGGEGMWQEALNKTLVALVAGTVAWFIRKKYHEQEAQAKKVDEVHQAMFGAENVASMEGMVEVMEGHEEDIENLYDKVEEERLKREEIDRRLTRLRERVEGRHNDNQQ